MDALSKLLALPEEERKRRGLVHTPGEIAQQPDTWRRTYDGVVERAGEIREFLSAAGVSGGGAEVATVYLVGAGTSDYIGRALTSLLRREWGCETRSARESGLPFQRSAPPTPAEPSRPMADSTELAGRVAITCTPMTPPARL
jgi:tagatose-6-phosphate ketose/aldose isomerase